MFPYALLFGPLALLVIVGLARLAVRAERARTGRMYVQAYAKLEIDFPRRKRPVFEPYAPVFKRDPEHPATLKRIA